MDLTNQKVSGTNFVSLQDSLNAAALGLKIKAGANVVAPQDNDLIVYVDTQPQSNPSNERKQYVFNLISVLKSINTTGDELVEEIEIKNNQANLKAYVIRRIEEVSGVDSVAQTPTIEELEAIDVTLFEGVNYIYTNYSNVEVSVTYPKDNDLNRLFINSSIFNRNKELNNDFGLDDIYFKDAFTKMGDELNEEIDNLNVKCITSKNNTFSLDSQGNLVVNSITSNSGGSSLSLLDVYPVGSIYMSVNNVSPSTLFGGTWAKIEDKFLLASGSTYINESTGGTSTNTLVESNLPGRAMVRMSVSGTKYGCNCNVGITNSWANICMADGGFTHSQSINNMPPYLVVNIWKRTA